MPRCRSAVAVPAPSWPRSSRPTAVSSAAVAPLPESGRVSRAIHGRPLSACSTAGSTRPSVTAGSTRTRPGGAVFDQAATSAHCSGSAAAGPEAASGSCTARTGPATESRARTASPAATRPVPVAGRHDHGRGVRASRWSTTGVHAIRAAMEIQPQRTVHGTGTASAALAVEAGTGSHAGHPPPTTPTSVTTAESTSRAATTARSRPTRSARADTATATGPRSSSALRTGPDVGRPRTPAIPSTDRRVVARPVTSVAYDVSHT